MPASIPVLVLSAFVNNTDLLIEHQPLVSDYKLSYIKYFYYFGAGQ